MSADQGGAGRREVAWRVFAAEFDDSTVDYSESDEERAPNYVITPTGARVNRLFVVGVLTEVEAVSDDVLRARIVDPTGAFVVYAGQYQPEAMAFLESATPPQFVAVTGKARTFQPEDSDRVFTSIRPESINRVDADTRDRWTVQTAEHTLERVSTFADALDFGEGVDVEQALLDGGVDAGLAAGIPLAMQHYGTTKAYLADVWSLALDSIRVVAGEIDADEVGPLTTDPDEPGEVDVAFDRSLVEAADVDVEPDVSPDVSEPETEAAEATEAADATAEDAEAEATAADAESTPDETEAVEDAEDAAEAQPTDEDASPEVSQEQETVTDEEFEPEPDEDEELGTGGAADEMYEMDEEERQEVEQEFGTEFTSGAEIGAPGEADIETPSPDEDEADLQETSETLEEAPEQTETADSDRDEADETGEAEPVDQAEEATSEDATAEDVADEAEEAAEERPDDLEETVMEKMRELNEGDGVGREELMAAVVHDYDVTPEEVENALQDALMSGQCYESGEDTFSPI